ncbi:KEOPS complex subunit Pcc1 [Haloplanus sp. GCM10025708]|uniref:KEOPS complex subunit Pcc1 n=1 Tax=Haloferacaceae TaxID=1644056 RepID=UPI00360F9C73
MRRANVRTEHEAAALVAASLRPDNTDSMTTTVDGDYVATEIERETTGGLHATVDDYVVNLTVAETVAQTAHTYRNHE